MRDIVTTDMFFTSPRRCWEENRNNTLEFMKKQKCHKIDYHNEKTGCLPFDDAMVSISTEEYKTTMMVYYDIYPFRDQPRIPRYATTRLAGSIGTNIQRSDEILLLSRYVIAKTQPILINGPLPKPFWSWPEAFVPTLLARTKRQREILLKSIENCIQRRMEFRNKCAIPCSKKIKKQEIHDEFIVMLQILRARLIANLAYINSDRGSREPGVGKMMKFIELL